MTGAADLGGAAVELRARRPGELLDVAVGLARRVFKRIAPWILAVEVPFAVVAFLLAASEDGDGSRVVLAAIGAMSILFLPAVVAVTSVAVPIAHAEYLGRSLSGGRSALTALKRAPVLVLYAIVGLFAYSFVAGGVLLVSVFAVSIPLNLLKTALSGINEQIATVVAAAVAVVGTIAWMSLFLGVFSRFLVGMVSVLVERRGPFAAFGRGWRLTRGAWVRHGVLLFLATILSYVLLTLLTMLAAWIGGSAEGSLAAAATAALYFVVYGVVAFPLWAALAVTMYVDGRVRREALDLEMLLGSLAPVPA